ncbi:MAG: toll/interleukin-1 receptor domain-containing protein, partial [Cyanobacteria bacterium J06649_5]
FISYSHQEEKLKDDLCIHLATLERQNKIKPWQDRHIEAGHEWDAEIKAHLDSAHIILLLITPRFIASEYCFCQEMTRAMERHEEGTARVISIIMKHCDWKDTPFSKLQVVPKDAKPVTAWDDRDEALLNAVQSIRKAVNTLLKQRSDKAKAQLAETSPAKPPTNSATTTSPIQHQAESPFIVGTPITNPHQFFGRQRVITRLFNMLKTHPLQNAAIIGKRRSGKTSLLNHLRTLTTTPPEQLRPGQRANYLPNPETYRWIFVDFQDSRMASREKLLSHLLMSMQLPIPSHCNLDHFMEAVSGNIHAPTVVLMDEVGVGLQRCPELDDSFWESLRALATNQTDGNLAFVLATPEKPMDLARNTGHSSPFFNIFGYTKTLGPLKEDEARALIASSPIPFAAADVDWIIEKSQCWPILLQRLCQEGLFSLEEKDTSDDWKVEGLDQLTLFQHLLKST